MASLIRYVCHLLAEPKIKFYAELRCSSKAARDGTGEAFLATAVQDAIDQLLKPAENKLIAPSAK